MAGANCSVFLCQGKRGGGIELSDEHCSQENAFFFNLIAGLRSVITISKGGWNKEITDFIKRPQSWGHLFRLVFNITGDILHKTIISFVHYLCCFTGQLGVPNVIQFEK